MEGKWILNLLIFVASVFLKQLWKLIKWTIKKFIESTGKEIIIPFKVDYFLLIYVVISDLVGIYVVLGISWIKWLNVVNQLAMWF